MDAPDSPCVECESSVQCISLFFVQPTSLCNSTVADDANPGFESVGDLADEEFPDQGTLSFLFDGVLQETVERRAVSEPAYARLAALRERVLARLNAHL